MKFIALFVALAFFIAPLQAEASPYAVTMQPQGRVAPMQEGDVAPFAGTLFDVQATAQILIDKELAKEQCELDSQQVLDKQEAEHALALTNLRASRDAAQRREREIVALKNSQINFLSEQLELAVGKPKRNLAGLWVSLGVLGGVLVTIAAGYALGRVN